jgi:hypothetical protein
MMIQGFTGLIVIVGLWDLFWKGKGLWRSAQRGEKWWFIAILVVNSIGILPIIYLVFFSKKKK